MINIHMNTDNKIYLQNLSEDFKERLRQINNALYRGAASQNTFPNPPSSVELPYPEWMGGKGPLVTLTPQKKLKIKDAVGEFWPFRNHIDFLRGMGINNPTITHELAHAQQNIAAQFKNPKNAEEWIDSLRKYVATGKTPKNTVGAAAWQQHIPYPVQKAEVDARAMDTAKEAQNFKWDWLKSQKAALEPKPTNPVMQTLSRYFPNLAPKTPEMPSFDDWVNNFNTTQRRRLDSIMGQENWAWREAGKEPTDLKYKVGEFNWDPEKNAGNLVSSGDTPEQRQQFHRDRRSYRNEMDPRNLKRTKGKVASGWQAGLDLFQGPNAPNNVQNWLKAQYDNILAGRGESISVATPSATPTTPQAKPKTPTPVSTAPKQATMEPKAPLRSGGIEVPETPMASKIPEIPAAPKEPMVGEFAPRGAKGGIGGIKMPLIGFGLAAATALANKAFGDTPTSWTDVANQTLQGGLESLNPLGIFDGGSLGTDDLPAELKGQYNFIEPKPKEQKELPGSEYMFPNKSEEPKPAPTPQPENTPEDVPSPKPGIRPASRGSEEQPPKTNTEPEKKDQEEDENPNSFKNQMKQVVFECLIKATK